MLREDSPLAVFIRYLACTPIVAKLNVRLTPLKKSVAPHWSRIQDAYRKTLSFYERYCAPAGRSIVNFTRKKIEASKKRIEERRQQAEAEAARQIEVARIEEANRQAEREAAARAAYDPPGAIEDMRLARSYLDDWIDKKGDHVLGLAAKYIELARTKDANASLSLEIKKGEDKGEIITYSLDELAGTTLFYQSQIHSYPDAPRDQLEQTRDLLKRALAYVPTSVQYRRHLADVYLDLHDKQSALEVTQEALSANPKDLEARKLQDHVENAPTTFAPSPIEGKGGLICASIGGLLIIFSIIQLFRGEFSNSFGLFVFAAIFAGVANLFESDQTFKKALEHVARENNPRR